MTDQEKLVELLEATTYEALGGNLVVKAFATANEFADHLIANGVTMKQMQKPLTVEEATGTLDVVWFEQKHLGTTYPCDAVIAPDCVNVNMSMIGYSVPLVRPIKGYGKTWRCWAEKPTEEERMAAEWLK